MAHDLINLVIKLFSEENKSQRDVVEGIIIEYQRRENFCEALQGIVMGQGLAETGMGAHLMADVQNSAALLMKATIFKYWTEYDGYVIPESERNTIRHNLLNLLLVIPMTEKKIYYSVESILIFIIQGDFPLVWESAITDVLKLVENEETRAKGLSLLFGTIKLIIKAPDQLFEGEEGHDVLKAKRTRLCDGFADTIFSVLSPLWLQYHQEMLAAFSQFCQGQLAADQLPIHSGLCCKLSLSSLRLIFNRAYNLLNVDNARMFFTYMYSLLENSAKCRMTMASNSNPLVPFLDGTIKRILKLLFDCVHYFPLRFVACSEPFFKFALEELMVGFNVTEDFWSKYTVNLMYFVAEILCVEEFNFREDSGYEINNYDTNRELNFQENIQFGRQLVDKYFSDEQLFKLFEVIAVKYLLLTEENLNLWDDDPEEILIDTFTDAYTYSITPASEFLLNKMLKKSLKFQQLATHYVAASIQGCWERALAQGNVDTQSVLFIESLYFIFSVFARSVSPNEANFKHVYCHLICKHYHQSLPKFIKRRVCQIIQAWADDIYTLNLELLSLEILHDCFLEEDIVTKVYATLALKAMLDDFDYKKPQAQRFLYPFICAMIGMIDQMESAQAIVFILKLVSSIIMKVKEAIRPHMQDILNKVYRLWDDSSQKNVTLIQAACIKIVSSLIVALVGSAIELENVYVPILRKALNMNEVEMDNEMQVLEEGLKLWFNCISQAPFLTPDVMKMFGCMEAILRLNATNERIYKLCFRVILAYLVIGKGTFLKNHLNLLNASLTIGLVHLQQPDILTNTMITMSTIVRLFPKDFPQFLAPALVDVFKLMFTDTSGFAQSYSDGPIPCGVFLFFDILFQNQAYFMEFMGTSDTNGRSRLYSFVDLAVSKVSPNLVPRIDHQRVIVMGLALLLKMNDQYLLSIGHAIFETCLLYCADISVKLKSVNTSLTWLPINMFNHLSPAWRNMDALTKAQLTTSMNETLFLLSVMQECTKNYGSQWDEALRNALSPTSLDFLKEVCFTTDPDQLYASMALDAKKIF